MDSLFGVSLDVWLAVSAIFDLLFLAALAAYGLRHPLLLRSAARYPRRRPWQSLLIVLGLSLSTIIVSTSFNTGDTMSFAIRSLVAGSVGRADELVIAVPRGRGASPAQYLQSLLDGSFLSGNGDFFPVSDLNPVMDAARQDARIAQVLPVIGLKASATNLDQRVTVTDLSLTAVPPNDGPVFQSVPTSDGGRLAFAQLGPDDVLVDERAAATLSASEGDSIRLTARDVTYEVRVRAIASGAELGGMQPSLYVNLEAFQQHAGRIGQVNRALVANAGSSADAVQLSSSVAQTLRAVLADPRAAQRLFDLLRGDAARAELSAVQGSLDARSREKLRALLQTLDESAVTSRFVALASDPDLERRLAGLAFRLAATGQGLPGFSELAPLRVVEVKQAALDQATRWGTALTSAFLVLGFFSLVTGLLLVILIFSVLAAERRSELGITRALGGSRGYLVLGLIYEGVAYCLGGSLLGLVLGSAAALVLGAVGNAALEPYGLRLEPHLEPRSLLLSLSLGMALTILSILFAAWRATRLSPLAAMRNLPDPPTPHRTVLRSIGLLPVGLLLLWAARTFDYGLALTLGVLCVVVGCAAIARAALRARRVSPENADRLAFTLAGLALLLYWLLPFDVPFAPPRPNGRNLDVLFGAGCSLVLGGLWVVIYNLRSLLRPLEAAAGRTARLRLGLRLAASHPASAPGRTGLTAGMFTLVIFSMVVSSVLLTATHRAYSDPEALSGGFDVRADVTRPADLPDLPAAIKQAEAIRPEDVNGIGRLTGQPAQVIDPAAGMARWQPSTLRTVDAGFIEGLRSPLAARAREFSSDRQLWEALVGSPGLAVLSSPSSMATGGLTFGGLLGGPVAGGAFQPTTIWARDDRGQAIPLRVVGLLDPRVTFGAGLYTGQLSVQDARWSPPPQTTYYVKAGDGVAPENLALGLSASFQAQDLRVSTIGEDVRRIQSVRSLLNELLQGFFGIGLLAGLAALGLLALRAVMERRYEIGLLRALGASRRLIALAILAEAAIVAAIGTTLGIVLGLAMASRLVEHLARQNPELSFSLPVEQVAGIAALAWAASLAMTAAPARGAAAIPPVDALRDPA